MREEMNIQNSFYEACKEGDIGKILFFLEKGADIENKDELGDTPLHWASYHEHIEIEVLQLLLEKGADIEAKNRSGITPLIYASAYGRIKVVKFLIQKGADIEVKANCGKTFYDYLYEIYKKEIDFLLEDIEERKRMVKPCKK